MGERGEIVILVMVGVLIAALVISVVTQNDPKPKEMDRSDYAMTP